eukprot:scaffold15002_cov131-Isochrysis_galbana.AAC.1
MLVRLPARRRQCLLRRAAHFQPWLLGLCRVAPLRAVLTVSIHDRGHAACAPPLPLCGMGPRRATMTSSCPAAGPCLRPAPPGDARMVRSALLVARRPLHSHLCPLNGQPDSSWGSRPGTVRAEQPNVVVRHRRPVARQRLRRLHPRALPPPRRRKSYTRPATPAGKAS